MFVATHFLQVLRERVREGSRARDRVVLFALHATAQRLLHLPRDFGEDIILVERADGAFDDRSARLRGNGQILLRAEVLGLAHVG